MLNFVARVFRGWMNVLLWLILIGFAIVGFIAFGLSFAERGEDFNVGYAFLGLLICGFTGLVTVILSGGIIANFLNMVDNIDKQYKLLQHIHKNDLPKDLQDEYSNSEKYKYTVSNLEEVPSEEELKNIIDNMSLVKNDNLIAINSFDLKDSRSLSSNTIKNIYKGNYLKYITTVEKWYYIETQDGKKGYCLPNKVEKRT